MSLGANSLHKITVLGPPDPDWSTAVTWPVGALNQLIFFAETANFCLLSIFCWVLTRHFCWLSKFLLTQRIFCWISSFRWLVKLFWHSIFLLSHHHVFVLTNQILLTLHILLNQLIFADTAHDKALFWLLKIVTRDTTSYKNTNPNPNVGVAMWAWLQWGVAYRSRNSCGPIRIRWSKNRYFMQWVCTQWHHVVQEPPLYPTYGVITSTAHHRQRD